MEDEIYEIIAKVIAGETMSDEERQDLEVWRLEHEREYQLLVRLKEPVKFIQERGGIVQEVAYKRVARRLERGKQRKIRRYAYISAVAGVVLVIGIALTWWVQPFEEEGMMEQSFRSGNGQVMLTLKHGVVVPLKRDVKEVIVADTTLRVTNEGNTLVYSVMQGVALEDTYNVLTVPVGGEFRVILSDGTMVFLNSGSELRYPEVFRDGQREVFLKGEAWFEVAKDTGRPFYVETDEVSIRVYGTAFNVNTHGLRATETVLVEGEIGISGKGSTGERRMRPGQLAACDHHSGEITFREVDIRKYTAWKNGEFCFNDDTLEEILEELGRWYDVKVIFRSAGKKDIRFSGHLKRYENIQKILGAISESTGIVFHISDRMIIVE